MRIGIVVPHIFMQDAILPHVIFAPAKLALDLCEELALNKHEVVLFTPGPVRSRAKNITADLNLFEAELAIRGDDYISLLKKHPFTFITLARQVQSELIAKAYELANANQLDVVHIYTNEEDTALPFAALCQRPVVFTHHDPFNFLIKYKSVFPKYPELNWISMSFSQRKSMPKNTNWVANIYHGIAKDLFKPNYAPRGNYVVYMGRIIEPKGVHLAIAALQKYNANTQNNLKLKIAGKHYTGHKKDTYWQTKILPFIDNQEIEYIGFIKSIPEKQELLSNAKALVMPSIFEEPFGMVMIEALACGTPVIGLNSGAIPEIICDPKCGTVAPKALQPNGKINETKTAKNLATELSNINNFDRRSCRKLYEEKFTLRRMANEHLQVYEKLIK